MCMCANLEGQYHDESVSAPVGVRRRGAHAEQGVGERGRGMGRGLATAQHLCGALVGLVDPGLVGIGLREEANA